MTTMNRGQLTTLAAGESSAQLEKDTPAWRIARANEIFDYVWGKDPSGDRLDSVAEEAMWELRGVADDFTAVTQALNDSLRNLRAMLPDVDEAEDMSDEYDLMGERVGDIDGWVKPLRELADRLDEALADRDAEGRVA